MRDVSVFVDTGHRGSGRGSGRRDTRTYRPGVRCVESTDTTGVAGENSGGAVEGSPRPSGGLSVPAREAGAALDATGIYAGRGPFDRLRALARETGAALDATGICAGPGPFDRLRVLAREGGKAGARTWGGPPSRGRR